MVAPLRARNTSPGFTAFGPGMFSVTGAIAVTLTPTSSSPHAEIVANTMAAPLISVFMVVMPSGVLRDRPPESKVMPLPTSTTWGTRPSISTGSAGS